MNAIRRLVLRSEKNPSMLNIWALKKARNALGWLTSFVMNILRDLELVLLRELV